MSKFIRICLIQARRKHRKKQQQLSWIQRLNTHISTRRDTQQKCTTWQTAVITAPHDRELKRAQKTRCGHGEVRTLPAGMENASQGRERQWCLPDKLINIWSCSKSGWSRALPIMQCFLSQILHYRDARRHADYRRGQFLGGVALADKEYANDRIKGGEWVKLMAPTPLPE